MSTYTMDLELEVEAINHYDNRRYEANADLLTAALQSVDLRTVTRPYPETTAIYISSLDTTDPSIKWVVVIPKHYEFKGYEVFYSSKLPSKGEVPIGTVNSVAGVVAMVTSKLRFEQVGW